VARQANLILVASGDREGDLDLADEQSMPDPMGGGFGPTDGRFPAVSGGMGTSGSE
jgi:hypothetical protein